MIDWVLAMLFTLQPEAPWTDTYFETAQAIVDASEESPLFKGEDGPQRTAAVLVSLAWFESRFDQEALGDHGRSCGLFQIQPRTSGKTCEELQDADTAAREAIRLIRESFRVCARRPFSERLAWYAGGGSCSRGLRASRHRLGLARRIEAGARQP
jgi:hypothetical protein